MPLDSVLFCVVAFGGVFPASTVWQFIVANVVIKVIASFLTAPTIYLVPDFDVTLAGLRSATPIEPRGHDQLLRPALGLRPWLAFLRRTFAFFLLVRFDIGEQP